MHKLVCWNQYMVRDNCYVIVRVHLSVSSRLRG